MKLKPTAEVKTSVFCLTASTRVSVSAGLSKYVYGVRVVTAFFLRTPLPLAMILRLMSIFAAVQHKQN
jgi:hypothetical protein